jgi:curved DNA-binding protein CbpA
MDYTIDYYHILQVGINASKEELKAAYRRLAKLHHPDKNPNDPGSAARFHLVQEAYEVLSNEVKRHVYDEYRREEEPESKAQGNNKSKEKSTNGKSSGPSSRTYTQTRKKWQEKRIYLFGRINVKFQGKPSIMESFMANREQDYHIFPTITLVTIQSSGIYRNGPTKDYEKAYSTAELFAIPLSQPLRCQLDVAGVIEEYELTIHDLRIKKPVILNITKHEQDNFGELVGDFYGYIVHRYEEDVIETFTEYFGPTGKVETMEKAGVVFTRQEFYNKDGSRYWSEWGIIKSADPKNHAKWKSKAYATESQAGASLWSYIKWAIFFLILLLIWPKMIVLFFGLFLVFWLIKLFMLLARPMASGIYRLGSLLFMLFLFSCMAAFFSPSKVPSNGRNSEYQPPETLKMPIENNNNDSIITHLVNWDDYNGKNYQVTLRILQSDVNASHQEHQSIPINHLSTMDAGTIYKQLIQIDSGKLTNVYQVFDSVAKANRLNESQEAKMIVSCIQSMPYYLIVERSCSSNYNDEFIRNYLQHCQNDCCLGNIKYGVQSPAEFIGDLKGDCDTRALVLFDILSKLGYDVALLTSEKYQHALIAVHFKNDHIPNGSAMPIMGNNYYLWETTSAGHQVGELPEAINNLQYWTISLIHHQ